MAPELLSADPTTSTPTPASDVYALAVTLLYIVLGCLPFAAAPNVFMKREWIKQGDVMRFAMEIGGAEARLKALRESLMERGGGFDVLEFLNMGLRKGREERVEAGEWRAWLEKRMVGRTPCDGVCPSEFDTPDV